MATKTKQEIKQEKIAKVAKASVVLECKEMTLTYVGNKFLVDVLHVSQDAKTKKEIQKRETFCFWASDNVFWHTVPGEVETMWQWWECRARGAFVFTIDRGYLVCDREPKWRLPLAGDKTFKVGFWDKRAEKPLRLIPEAKAGASLPLGLVVTLGVVLWRKKRMEELG